MKQLYFSEKLSKALGIDQIIDLEDTDEIEYNYFDFAIDDNKKLSYINVKNRGERFCPANCGNYCDNFWNHDKRKTFAYMAKIGKVIIPLIKHIKNILHN